MKGFNLSAFFIGMAVVGVAGLFLGVPLMVSVVAVALIAAYLWLCGPGFNWRAFWRDFAFFLAVGFVCWVLGVPGWVADTAIVAVAAYLCYERRNGGRS